MPRLAFWWHRDMFFTKLRAYFSRNILVVSKEIKEQLVSWWQYPPDKVLVKYHGVELKEYCKLGNEQQQAVASRVANAPIEKEGVCETA